MTIHSSPSAHRGRAALSAVVCHDQRGACVPLDAVVRLEVWDETVENERVIVGLEMDIGSHEVKKFFV